MPTATKSITIDYTSNPDYPDNGVASGSGYKVNSITVNGVVFNLDAGRGAFSIRTLKKELAKLLP